MTNQFPENPQQPDEGNFPAPEPGSEAQTNPYAAAPEYPAAQQPYSTQPEPGAYGTPTAPEAYPQGEYAGYPQATPGYPTNGQPGAYGYQQPMPTNNGTDGFSIAALITGVLGMGIIPIILGIVGLNNIKKTGKSGKGMAIAGIILGAIGLIITIVASILFFIGINAAIEDGSFSTSSSSSSTSTTASGSGSGSGLVSSTVLETLYNECAAGDMESCDALYMGSETGSEYEEFGNTCGNRVEAGWFCSERDDIPGINNNA